MIAIPHGLCRAFPALARKCVSGGPAPAVVFEAKGGTRTVWVETDDAALAYTAPTEGSDEVLVAPMAMLEAAAGPGGEPVELCVGSKLKGEDRWSERGVPKSHPFEAILPGKQHRPPDAPEAWHAVPIAFLAALHECGRPAAKDAGRFSLTRVQLRGKAGQVVATDGRTALLRGGFSLPFTEDVLAPALPVFGTRELVGERAVRLGRTTTHLIVAAGSWRVFLPIDKTGRYPDVAGVVPRNAPTTVAIDDRDAAELIEKLSGLPGGEADHRPVALAVDSGFVVRAGEEKSEKICEVRLRHSTANGPGVRAVIDRRVLGRALALGCRTVRLTPDKPVVFERKDTTLLTVALDPALAVGPKPDTNPTITNTRNNKETAVKSETNGHPPNGRHDPPDADSPLLAEELRAALGDALTAAGRLVAALKHQKKEKKALTQVWSSMKALNLGRGASRDQDRDHKTDRPRGHDGRAERAGTYRCRW
ncbi:hypothetical protein VT84_31180 [Gemmata sp. SH-PL17]|uniref:hypothetical protein n=1 Tax=Gemmata sp. SH-PL17 TaxID=1630693 RepID=UPI00078BAEE1|nr:hypothetical protein [Gemmata sp. SH-PL17]AMV28898.1 hypothetical protein VT84_31180 [Gemmata sp. SH-PL17]